MLTAAALKPRGRGACPAFFVARCREASRGGTNGYEWAAYSLAGALGNLAPKELEEDEWAGKLDALSALIEQRNDQAILTWFDRWLPRCMAPVPRRRRRSFLDGVYRYLVHEGNSIDC